MNDPFGQAISDYYRKGKAKKILVNSNYTENEIIPVNYFFRTFSEMPLIEQKALKLCAGKVLDVGAAAGCHSLYLQEKSFEVFALEKSSLACNVLKLRGIKNILQTDIFTFTDDRFDTILLLMNGAGIGGTKSGLLILLHRLKNLLKEGGQVLIDSSDIKYLFQEDDGSFWLDLASEKYYGEMEYEVNYLNHSTVFNWLFIDFLLLKKLAQKAGFICELVETGEHYDYLARLSFQTKNPG